MSSGVIRLLGRGGGRGEGEREGEGKDRLREWERHEN